MYKAKALPFAKPFEEILVFTLAVLFFALAGQVAIPLAFSPVPLVLQVNLALLYGALFGSKRAVAMMLTILGLAAYNLPVLAGGAGGIARLIGPTGGYLLGYVLAAYVMGRIVETRKVTRFVSCYGYFLLANLCVYALGVPYLSLFVGIKKVLLLGFLPFLPGMFLKNIFTVRLYFALKESRYVVGNDL